MSEERFKTEEKPLRDENGLFLKGTAPGPGRPKGKTLKEYQAEKFRQMTDEEKESFLADVIKDTRWKMAEGMPSSETKQEISGTVTVELSETIANKNSNDLTRDPESDSSGQAQV